MLRDYFRILVRTRRDTRLFGVLLVVMLVAAGLEAVGVGLVMPFVAVVQDPKGARSERHLAAIADALGVSSEFGIIAIAGALLVGVFIFKNAYLAVSNHIQMRFVFNRLTRTCDELMASYLARPYPFFVQRSSTDLVRVAVTDATNVFQAGVPSFLAAMVESFTSIVIVAFLIYLEPVAVPIAGVLMGGAGFAFFRFFRRRSAALGEVARTHQGRMLTWAHQAFGGIKETKVLGVEGFFMRAFHDGVEQQSGALRRQRQLVILPRYALELLGVIGLVGVVLGVTARGVPTQRLLPLLGALALAVMRLMPSAVRILSTVNEMRFCAAGAHAIAVDLAAAPTASKLAASRDSVTPLPFERELRTVQLGYTYDNAKRPALEDVNITIRKGEAVGLVGASGAGKTTLVDLLLGVLTPNTGSILIDGDALDPEAMARWQRLVGYIPQSVYLTDDTLRRNVAFGVEDGNISEEQVTAALRAAQLYEFVMDLPEGLDTVVGERGVRLSGGQKQRIGIARALYFLPQVLVLDEATSALDGITEHDVVDAIEALRKDHTTIVIAHRLSTVRHSDRIIFMEGGRVVQVGTWDELMKTSEAFQTLARLAGAA